MTAHPDDGLSGRAIGRYVLDDLVAEKAGTTVWRATDPALRRPVSARLIPLDHPRVADLRAAAQHAAGVHDRRVVRLLDVVETDGYLAIISEWITGNPWPELLTERWSPQEATVVALEVAKALEAAHAVGVTHGRLHPDSVMITDSQEVRLRGLGIDAVLLGVDPSTEPERADLHGVGALLYAGLTRRWPGVDEATSDGLPPAPTSHGATQPPSTVAPDVPPTLDRIVARCLVTGRPPRKPGAFTDMGQCVDALERAFNAVPHEDVDTEFTDDRDSATDKMVGRLSTVAVAILAIAGLGLLAWQLIVNIAAEPDDPSVQAATQLDALPPVETPAPESPFAIVDADDFDPGGDQSEGQGTARKAIDKKRDTAWYTDSYSSPDLNGKGGVGLLLDPGAVRPVRAINLKLVGTGSDFEIRTARNKSRELSDFRRVIAVKGAGDSIKVRTPKPRKARFVLVWLTRLPFDGSYYTGGIRDVNVVG